MRRNILCKKIISEKNITFPNIFWDLIEIILSGKRFTWTKIGSLRGVLIHAKSTKFRLIAKMKPRESQFLFSWVRVFESISVRAACILSLFTFREISKNYLMSFALRGAWRAFLALLLLEIDADGSLSFSELLRELP